jgi:MFS family permease
VWAILGLVFLAALPASYYESTTSAVVPEYAPDEGTRDDALVLFQSTQQAANMVGFLTGGALLAVLGVPAALAANALSYLVAAALLSGIPRLAALADEDETSLGLAVQGIRAIARQPLLRGAVLITVVTASTIMAGEALVIVIADAVDHPGWAGAMAATTAAIAALLGLLLPRHRPSHELLRLSALVMASGLALAMVVFAGLNGAWGAFVGFMALGLVSAPAALTYVVAIRELTPANRASVFALVQVALMGGQALVAVLAGWLADQLSVGAAVALLQVPALGLVLWVAAESHVPERGLASPSDDQRVVPEAEPVDPELLGAATAEPVSDCEPSGAISAEDAESAPR